MSHEFTQSDEASNRPSWETELESIFSHIPQIPVPRAQSLLDTENRVKDLINQGMRRYNSELLPILLKRLDQVLVKHSYSTTSMNRYVLHQFQYNFLLGSSPRGISSLLAKIKPIFTIEHPLDSERVAYREFQDLFLMQGMLFGITPEEIIDDVSPDPAIWRSQFYERYGDEP